MDMEVFTSVRNALQIDFAVWRLDPRPTQLMWNAWLHESQFE